MDDGYSEVLLPPDQMQREQGLCWMVSLLPEAAPGDDPGNPARSRLPLVEDGRPLGLVHDAASAQYQCHRDLRRRVGACVPIQGPDRSDGC